MKYCLIFVSLISLACNHTTSKNKKSQLAGDSKKEMTISDHLKFKDIMELTLPEAIEKYGEPYKREHFILDDLQGEFRNNISDQFTTAERLQKNISINELTWEKDSQNYITVWYQEMPGKSLPKSYLIWDKKSEF